MIIKKKKNENTINTRITETSLLVDKFKLPYRNFEFHKSRPSY